MPGTLFVVATPIGNLEDVTLRALRILREVSLIAAEDTRRTGRLLQHYSISTPTTSLHEHNERQKTPSLVQRLLAGESVALVSDAGTPALSDPGQGLVAAAHAAGIRVEPVPGPSAVLALLSASGIAAQQFMFAGFPPIRSTDRATWMEQVARSKIPVIAFEAPHRIDQFIGDLTKLLGADRTVAVGRELTKAHEQVVICPISELPSRLASTKGEFVLMVTPAEDSEPTADVPGRDEIIAELGRMTAIPGGSRRAALKELSTRYGVPVNELYRLLKDEP